MSRAALASRAGLATSGFYAALFLGLGAHLPFWPLWLAEWGLDAAEIGQLLGLAILARVAGGSLLPALADRYARRRLTLGLCGGLAGVATLAHLAADSLALLTVLTLVVAVAASPLLGLGEAMGLRAAETHGFAYAHTRAVGSLSFLAAVLGLGALIEVTGPGAILAVVAVCFLATAGLGLVHPGGGAPPGELDQTSGAEARALLCGKLFLLFAAASALGQAAHAIYYTYSALAWREAGLSAGLIGALWAAGVLAEIALMLGPGRRWVARLGAARALVLAGAAGILRWGLMLFDPLGGLLWLAQALHAATFGLAHLAAMAFIAAALPRRMAATAQGISAGLIGGLTLAGATLLAGWLAPFVSISALYWIAVALAVVATLAALALSRLWDQGRIVE